MILVDTSVWIDHFRVGDGALTRLLLAGQVATHPFIVGELALGNLANRRTILDDLDNLAHVPVATQAEVRTFIDAHGLAGSGIGYVDAHLAASARLGGVNGLWTRDRRLVRVLDRLGLAAEPG